MQPEILIGLPCHGRPVFLKAALDHLARQTFRDFRILIHENPSGAADISEIVRSFEQAGAPISYHRHEANIGILANFSSVLEAARAPFFMWAADDDLRHPESLATLHGMLKSDESRHLAASSVEVINSDGLSIDHHAGFARFTSGRDRAESLGSFLAEPEIAGKANVIYGLFRTLAAKAALAAIGGNLPEGWGPDLVFLSAFLSRYDMVGTNRVLFRKRTNNARTKALAKRFPVDYGWPAGEFTGFKQRILHAIADPLLRAEAASVLDRRQRHIAGLGGLRRGSLKALGLDAGRPQTAAPGDCWIDGISSVEGAGQ